LFASRAFSGELLVFNNNDSGDGSLRHAILLNNADFGGGDTIVFTNVSGTILLTSGELLVTAYVTILGPGPGNLSVIVGGPGRAFHISGTNNPVNAFISGLTIAGGNGAPGCVYNDHATLTLSNCVVTASPTGGIYNDGSVSSIGATLHVVACTVSNNSVYGEGGGISNLGYLGNASVTVSASTICGNGAVGSDSVGGGISNNGNDGFASTGIGDSTISGNSADEGGGIWNTGAGSGTGRGILNIDNTTFSGNTASISGGGIFNNTGDGFTLVTLENTILNAGASGANLTTDGSRSIVTYGYNLCSDSGAGFLTNATDRINTDPLLGPLADNGGPTPTHAPLPGSPAIDKGKNSFGATTDQRGEPRPFDFPSIANAAGGDGSDIGAVEIGRPTLAIQQIGKSVLLSWPLYYQPNDFRLQFSGNLASSSSWANASGSPVVVGNQYELTNTQLSSKAFFRLLGR
jgi:hypothetical protein